MRNSDQKSNSDALCIAEPEQKIGIIDGNISMYEEYGLDDQLEAISHDMPHVCELCKHNGKKNSTCIMCKADFDHENSKWEWRGPIKGVNCRVEKTEAAV